MEISNKRVFLFYHEVQSFIQKSHRSLNVKKSVCFGYFYFGKVNRYDVNSDYECETALNMLN